MHWKRNTNGIALLHIDVVTAVYPDQLPASTFEYPGKMFP